MVKKFKVELSSDFTGNVETIQEYLKKCGVDSKVGKDSWQSLGTGEKREEDVVYIESETLEKFLELFDKLYDPIILSSPSIGDEFTYSIEIYDDYRE